MKLINAIKKLGFNACHVDGQLKISAEGDDNAAHYYGPTGGAWINPKLENLVNESGCFLEWENPGTLVVYQD